MSESKIYNARKLQGFTLVELMVAMAIGLLIILAVGSVFVGARQSYQDNEALARMQENARYALEMLTHDLKHAGFMGEMADPMELVVSNALNGILGSNANCAGGLFEFFSSQRYWLLDYAQRLDAPASHTELTACFEGGTFPPVPGSSVLSIKRVGSQPVTTRMANRIYVHTQFERGDINQGETPINPNGGSDWEYVPRVYYLAENDTLRRYQVMPGPAWWQSELIAEGIEAFHIEFGVDSNNDGVVDGFLDISDDEDSFGSELINSAMVANVYILARSHRGNHAAAYVDTKVYNLGAMSVDYSDPEINPAPVDPDNNRHYMRKVYQTTVVLRNLRNQTIIRGLGS